MTGRCLQLFRLTQYTGRKWFRWQLVYPPQEHPSIRRGERKSSDLPDTIKRKGDLFAVMRLFLLPSVPDWKPTEFKAIHPCGASCLKVLWLGNVWRDGRTSLTRSKKTETTVDLLNEPPFNLK
jgi:hypothetical protein